MLFRSLPVWKFLELRSFFIQVRAFLGLYEMMTSLQVLGMDLMKKFEPDYYLKQSEQWTTKKSLMDLLVISIIHGLLMGGCFLATWLGGMDLMSFNRMIGLTYTGAAFVLMPLMILIQMKIKFAAGKKTLQLQMNKLIRRNDVSPDAEGAHHDGDANNYEEEESDNKVYQLSSCR